MRLYGISILLEFCVERKDLMQLHSTPTKLLKKHVKLSSTTSVKLHGATVLELLTRYFNRLGTTPPNHLMTCARELDRHYTPSRYPNAHPSGTLHEAYDEETSKRA